MYKRQVLPLRTISVTAVDLHCTDEDIAALRAGRYTRVTSAPHGLDVRYVLTELDPDILDPGNTRITLGASVQTMTDRTHQSASQLGGAIDRQQAQINEQQSSLEQLAQTTSEQITAITQNSQQIILEALADYATTSDLETLQETISSQLSVMADQIEIRLTQTAQQIQDCLLYTSGPPKCTGSLGRKHQSLLGAAGGRAGKPPS